jgi:nicotinamidase-related amidase
MERPALLIIDMQNDFVLDDAPLKVAGAHDVIPRILEVLSAFRDRRLPVFHILRIHRQDGSDVEIIRQELFRKVPFAVEGTKGAEVIDELTPWPGEHIITKTRMSAFIGTELDLILRTLGITSLIVTGIQTPNCVRTTMFDAIANNYPVVLVDDAVGAASADVHRANARDMQNIGVRIVTAAEVPALLDNPSP